MLSKKANDRISRVGPGTPMGGLMRHYWQPIAAYSSLTDEPVQKIRILGENLVLYLSKRGNLGLISDKCAHRSMGMEYGIPEEDGLRCAYHGWLYDQSGQCIETPLEPKSSRLKTKVKMTGYPVREMGGLVWTYMGPDPAPVLPPWDLFVWPNAIRQIGMCVLPCNWLQCQENALDPIHSVYLHGHFFKYILERQGKLDTRASDHGTHRAYNSMKLGFGIESIWGNETEYGMEKGVIYSKKLGAEKDRNERHAYVIFPFYTRPGGGGIRREFQIRVPIDDTQTLHINYQIFVAPPGIQVSPQEHIPWFDVPMVDEAGKPILDHVLAQDMVAWWSQGDLTDRSKERLGTTDGPIIMFRKLLDEQIKIVEDGGRPKNFFTSQDQIGDIIHLTPRIDALDRDSVDVGANRTQYHKGYGVDEVDRYGPAMPQIIELMRQIEEAGALKGLSQSRG